MAFPIPNITGGAGGISAPSSATSGGANAHSFDFSSPINFKSTVEQSNDMQQLALIAAAVVVAAMYFRSKK